VCRRNPGGDRVPRLLDDLKLHRPLGLLLHNNRAGGNMTALDHIVDAEPDQIASAQLAIDGEIEQCKFPRSMIHLQPNSDSPDVFQLQRRLLAACLCSKGSHAQRCSLRYS
jgi:hypothetical protein